jgi:site-specific DNA-adenine methylase
MKNHFFTPYAGNKRLEVKNLYEEIKDNLEDITTIVEPFCGSSAFSYYLSTLHPKKFNYVLNDSNNMLIGLYNIASDDDKLQEIINKMNDFTKYIDNDKERFNEIVKVKELPNWIYKNMNYNIKPGLFPGAERLKKDFNKLKTVPIISFLKNENITFLNINGIEVVEQYKNDDTALIFLDPPYLASYNGFYFEKDVNIYQYLYINKISSFNCYVVLCLEDIWTIHMLFNDFIKSTYTKMYNTTKRKTNHIIISNKG